MVNTLSESKGLKNETLIAGLIVAAWLCVTLVVLGIFKITQGWPAWLILLFFFGSGANLKNLINISVGGIVGLLLAGVLPLAVGAIAPVLGLQVSILIVVFIIVFLLIGLGDVAHMFFNNYAFVYFTIAVIYPKQLTLEWLGVLILGGLFFVGGCLGFFKLLTRNSAPPESTSVA